MSILTLMNTYPLAEEAGGEGAAGGTAGGEGAAGAGAAGSGEGAGTGGEGAGAAGAGTAGAGEGAGTGGQSQSWLDSLPEDVRGYVENKGFADPAAVAEGYRNLEKLVGVPEDQLLRLPKEDDAEGWEKVFNKLGRPQDPSEYEIQRGEGMPGDEAYETWAKQTAHELGLTQGQLQGLVEKLDTRVKEHVAEQQVQQKADAETVEKQLRTEWGEAFDQKFANIDRVADSLGMTTEQLNGLREAMGPVEAMKFVDSLGTRLGEDQFVGGGGTALGARTPDAARAEIADLKRDTDFANRLANNDVEAKRTWDRLHQQAYPEG